METIYLFWSLAKKASICYPAKPLVGGGFSSLHISQHKQNWVLFFNTQLWIPITYPGLKKKILSEQDTHILAAKECSSQGSLYQSSRRLK